MKTLLVVAAALINEKNEILLAERPAHKALPGHFEFPGGKVEADETAEAALARELTEELGITVSEKDMEPFWFLSHTYHEFDFHLMMPVWIVPKWQGTPTALEHASIVWKHPDDMHALPLIEADDPLVAKLQAYVSAR
jgi:8-oxo-dGTP diphosphatase